MKKSKIKTYFALLLLFNITQAQFLGSNLLEYQLGNLPDAEPKNLSTLYDQLNLSYRFEYISLNVKLEQFQTADKSKSYEELAQRSIRFRRNNLEVGIGNFYHIIGRGLLLRSYEIPGTTIEDIGFRTRSGFYRDIDGFFIKYDPEFAEFKAFRGNPLNNTLPPTLSDDFRRPNLLEGIEANFYLTNWNFGGSYLRNNVQEDVKEYFSLNISANLPLDIQLYSEYAQQTGEDNSLFDLSNHSAHAFYTGLNFLYDPFGMTFEYKDYNDFLLGFNDPPPLVKEHQYLLLNRLTHRLIPLNESGWQTEIFYTLEAGHTVTVNIAEAVNETDVFRNIFKERFLELYYKLNQNISVKGFLDYSSETKPVKENRYSGGLYTEGEFYRRWGAAIDLEYQTVERTILEKEKLQNTVAILTISYAPDFSVGLIVERSNDKLEVDTDEDVRYWVGGTLSYQYEQNIINIFYGSRRGGNACTSGICYEILPFEGVEVRLTSIL